VLELRQPEPKDGEVLLRVRAAGVCGSDLHGFLGRSKKRVPPLVLGHEFAGEVSAVQAGVSGVAPGDTAAVYPIISCGFCEYCSSEREHLCPARRVYGLDFHGGLAEYVTVPARCLFPIPASMSFVEGSLVEPLANAVHVLKRCPDARGKTVLVYGGGPIGMLCALVAKLRGAKTVLIVDRNALRLSQLKELEAGVTIDASRQDPVASLLDQTGGRGVDFAIDAVGNTECRQNCISCTATGGTVLCIGLEEEVCAADTRPLVTREVDLRGAYAYSRSDFAEALSMLERQALPWSRMVTNVGLAQGQAIFDELAGGCSSILKAVFAV
jgi:L-iditol 2-dehydrogenase